MRIISQKPNLYLKTQSNSLDIKNETISAEVNSIIPKARMQFSKTVEIITTTVLSTKGSPIGLLLALTYPVSSSVTTISYTGGIAPNAKIITQ